VKLIPHPASELMIFFETGASKSGMGIACGCKVTL